MSTLTLDPIGSDALDLRPAATKPKACGCSTSAREAIPPDPALVGVSPSGTAATMAAVARFTVPPWLRAAGHSAGFPVIAIGSIIAFLAIVAPHQALTTIGFASRVLVGILPFFAISIALAAMAKATGAVVLISRAFVGRERRMIVMAALLGALSPFCSCGVIPVVTSLLLAGVPIAPVMAFWISSPLMDPNMFVLTAGGLGLQFAVAKTLAAIGMGLFAGFVTAGATRYVDLSDALRDHVKPSCGTGCGSSKPKSATPVWRFWREPERSQTFIVEYARNAWFLGRWLVFAFVLESLMVAYIPSELITRWLGGDSFSSVLIAVSIGIPAYLNGYAAIPLVAGLIDLGMNPAVGLGFMLGGGVTSVPAAMAVWAIAKPRLFGLYLALASVGSLIAAYAFMAYLAIR
jgi:uncharacterized membrane protein YraQ (UPF0718 family)